MDYIYFLANDSLILRVIDYVDTAIDFPLSCITVINFGDGWLVRSKLNLPLTPKFARDFMAFMNEIGEELEPQVDLEIMLWSLEVGQSHRKLMYNNRVELVSHHHSQPDDLKAFCQNFRSNLIS